MASRNSFDPQVIAYWFTSAAMASMALRLMSSGAEKSGKPCDRLTAPCFSASRVISRMTDSVNELAFCETWRLLEIEGVDMEFSHLRGTEYTKDLNEAKIVS